jgi:hypothetical protein
MGDTHIASQGGHVLLTKYISNQAITFPLMERISLTGHHPGSILTTMLKQR